jgi:hypothetical protein
MLLQLSYFFIPSIYIYRLYKNKAKGVVPWEAYNDDHGKKSLLEAWKDFMEKPKIIVK